MPLRGLCAILLVAAASLGAVGPAMAEDFTGFYAGVNAGYGFGRERQEGSAPAIAVTPGTRPAEGSGLPPSALNAARALKSPSRPSAAPGVSP